NTDRPRGNGLLFAVAYRVRVTGAIGSVISLFPAQFIYRTGGVDVPLIATPYQIVVSEPLSLCTNSIGLNNATEFGGTFGSGTTLNRTTDLTTPISGYSFQNNITAYHSLSDGRYALVNNMSPRNSTNRTANRTPNCVGLTYDDPAACNKRMHNGHWDIDGDHTGTTDAVGNLPPSAATNAGYMLMVNADFIASEVYSQTLNNLCPNTYYEFSAWFRNICPTCGTDSVGAQFAGTITAPAAGYPGVYPNLSFALNGFDYYSTGEIDLNGWQKKGFVFRTGPAQTSASFSIRNNSQGGGGNDWAMDDIAVATCLPTMSYSPTINPVVCEGNPILISDTISSFFKNYTTFKWQRSTDGGGIWTDLTGVTTLADTNYYVTSYNVAPAFTTVNDSGDLYRVVVATTAANLLDANCNISDGVTITLHVEDCAPFLDVNLISFSGKLVNSKGQLYWTTTAEDAPVTFKIERSTDGRNFTELDEMQGKNKGNELNYYSFLDPLQVNDINWYRIVMVSSNGKKKHSSIIQIKNTLTDFEVGNIVNPFANKLSMNITMIQSGQVTIELTDMIGNTIVSNKKVVHAGSNSIQIDTQSLASGVYTLKLYNKDKTVTRRVIKKY
ncbi:MAG: T9SS type A sorting domain-containing protein, partial [Flavitalea sp.]